MSDILGGLYLAMLYTLGTMAARVCCPGRPRSDIASTTVRHWRVIIATDHLHGEDIDIVTEIS